MPDETRRFLGRADVAVGTVPSAGARPGAGVIEAPTRIELPDIGVERLGFLEIRDRHRRELDAVVELLSPSNKRPGPGREQYLAKRGQVLASAAHLVEIDLLRGGGSMPVGNRPDCDYSVMVSRAEHRPHAGFWPIGLRDRLPAIPVPLRAPDGEARLDLQDLLHRLYDAAGYQYHIYEGEPEPPLAPEDAAWARALIA